MQEHERLKLLRKTLKYTQLQFSDALEIKQGSYSDVERGKAGVSASLIKHLIRKFKVNPLWLCEGLGAMFIGDTDPWNPQEIDRLPSLVEKVAKKNSPGGEVDKGDLERIITAALNQQRQLESLNSLTFFLK